MHKTCKKCLIIKDITAFGRHKQAKNGRKAICENCRNAQRRERYHNCEKTKRNMKNTNFKTKYGITIEIYEKMLIDQKGCCAICKLPELHVDPRSGKVWGLSVDHCHKSGVVRGLLCNSCNRGIGLLKDSAEIVKNASVYLNKHETELADNSNVISMISKKVG